VTTADTFHTDILWRSMLPGRYAAFELATAIKVVKIRDIWWQQVRPFLFRPLLPYKQYDSKIINGLTGRGILQFGVVEGQKHNSYLNPIVFDDIRKYEMAKLRYSAQKHIKKALKNNLTVSRITDEDEFVRKGYPTYLSFYQRTRYGFDTSRRTPEGFARWGHSLFQFPEAVVLGAFAGDELLSFEISCLVETTLILKTLVNSDKALKLGAPDLLLHAFRTSCRDTPHIHSIYDSMLGQVSGINDYYLIRGARVLAVPAMLSVPAPLLSLLRKANRRIYGRLVGLSEDQLPAHASSEIAG
jgi:hypothetical protein